MKTHLSACTETSQPNGDAGLLEQSNAFSEGDRTCADQSNGSFRFTELSCLDGRLCWSPLEPIGTLQVDQVSQYSLKGQQSQKNILDAAVVYVGDGELMTNYKLKLSHARLLDPSGSTSSTRGEDYYPGPAKY